MADTGTLSADVKLTAYLKFRRIYDDARKAWKAGREADARLLLGRSLLHGMRLLAAARDEDVPEPGDLPDWCRGQSEETQRILVGAFGRGALANRFGAAGELDARLARSLPTLGPMWESGRMRFRGGFSTDTLFFPEEKGGVRGWLDAKRDRGELVPAAERFFGFVRSESPKTGKEYRGLLRRAFEGTPDIEGILVFGSAAKSDDDWKTNDGKDVDLAVVANGEWFRRGLCREEGLQLDILRFPRDVLESGVETEDDLINNGLVTAEILLDREGRIAPLQAKVREKYPRGKTRPDGEEKERLEREMKEWVKWAEPEGDPLSDWVGLEVGLARALAIGFRLAGKWFPPDQDLVRSLEGWAPESVKAVKGFVEAGRPEEAATHLGRVAEFAGGG